ncbi:MAG TPA: phosphoglucosamine mutase [Nocardioidaceae bacterium]|nr:phosphoglucosamine mutase [Nocardioidaceae bacterium]
MGRLFGTDGVRGVANRDLTPELATALAIAAARTLVPSAATGARPTAVIGRDPRASGEMLEAAVVAGLASAGVDCVLLGVLPTPGTAYLTQTLEADLGVVISASHNPMPDNGIKFFGPGGRKLADAEEDAVEASLHDGPPAERPIGAGVGRVRSDPDSVGSYVTHLLSSTSQRLEGLRLVLDCAEGAASVVAPHVLGAAGAEVVAIHADPDGLSINDRCGSTHLADLQAAVLEHGADAGFAFDGDADRCLAVDATANVVDGDQIMAVLATSLRDDGMLAEDTLVLTVMSNLGLLQAMQREGIAVRQTAVGDRYVLEEMRAGGWSLGGEQSGHVIMADHAMTGDGVLTALKVAARMAATGRSLADLAGIVTRLPQVLLNVEGVDRSRADHPGLLADVAAEEDALGGTGRVLLRPSGTEPVVRVMVEAATRDEAERVASRLADRVRTHIALESVSPVS